MRTLTPYCPKCGNDEEPSCQCIPECIDCGELTEGLRCDGCEWLVGVPDALSDWSEDLVAIRWSVRRRPGYNARDAISEIREVIADMTAKLAEVRA